MPLDENSPACAKAPAGTIRPAARDAMAPAKTRARTEHVRMLPLPMDDATKLYTCKLISFLHVCTDSKINGVFAIVNDGATKLHQDTGQDGAADASASATSEQRGVQ